MGRLRHVLSPVVVLANSSWCTACSGALTSDVDVLERRGSSDLWCIRGSHGGVCTVVSVAIGQPARQKHVLDIFPAEDSSDMCVELFQRSICSWLNYGWLSPWRERQ